MPEDQPTRYRTRKVIHPVSRMPALVLQRRPNGACVYLGADGCTIYEDRPAACRKYDCRTYWAGQSRQQRKALIAAREVNPAILARARELVEAADVVR